MTAISSSDLFLPEQASVYREAAQRPSAVLDYFFMRRRSAAIGEQFWNVVARQWPGFNPIERTRWARLFTRFKSYWTPDILSPEDRAFYDGLPDDFTAYRGQNGAELAAAGSFTLSRDVAHRYALGRRNISYSEPTIVSLRVMKKHVALAFTARDEDEVVLFSAHCAELRLEAIQAPHVTH